MGSLQLLAPGGGRGGLFGSGKRDFGRGHFGGSTGDFNRGGHFGGSRGDFGHRGRFGGREILVTEEIEK